MSLRAAEFVLDEQISETSAEVIATYPWMRTIGEIRLGAFVNMAFNVGVAGLKKSPKMLLAAEAGNWELAASELLDGVYHKQVGIRAERLANQLRTGEWK
jgi:lysozyme